MSGGFPVRRSREIHAFFAREAKPGAPWARLYDMAKDSAARACLGEYFMGHGGSAKIEKRLENPLAVISAPCPLDFKIYSV